jgi:putative flavoprotein involved in K+ transport
MTPEPPLDATSPDTSFDVVVIGGSQAGLAMAWHLASRRLRFIVLEAGADVGHVWRSRWDSLRLFTPTQYSSLPGMAFPGAYDTYPTKDQVADYLRSYVERFDLPVRLNSAVAQLRRLDDGFEAYTADGPVRTRQVVVATGPFQVPFIPPQADLLGPDVAQLHASAYRNPHQLADDPVLVVGGANSGLQIAQELTASRPVDVAVGAKLPVLPQRLLGKDLFWWLTRLAVMRKTVDSTIGRRAQARDVVIGTRPSDLRRAGVTFHPRVVDASGHTVRFEDDTSVDVDTIVWATGYRSDYSWIDVPGVVSDGRVAHRRGVTGVPGMYFLGLSWQYTRGSALIGFVDDDARYIAGRISALAGQSGDAGGSVIGSRAVEVSDGD